MSFYWQTFKIILQVAIRCGPIGIAPSSSDRTIAGSIIIKNSIMAAKFLSSAYNSIILARTFPGACRRWVYSDKIPPGYGASRYWSQIHIDSSRKRCFNGYCPGNQPAKCSELWKQRWNFSCFRYGVSCSEPEEPRENPGSPVSYTHLTLPTN